jgi:hypothetical protein
LAEPKKRATTSRKRFIFSLGTLLVAGGLFIVIAELLVAFSVAEDASFEQWRKVSLTFLEDDTSDWVLEPRQYDWGEVNEHNLRGPSMPVARSPGVFRILVLGGSAAFDLYKRDSETWSEKVEVQLSRELGRPVEVLNAGTPGYSTWQSVRLYERKLHKWKPDMVLVYHLYNDSLVFRHHDLERVKSCWQTNGKANHISWIAHPHWALDLVGVVMPHTTDFLRFEAVKLAQKARAVDNEGCWVWQALDQEVAQEGFGFYRTNLANIIQIAGIQGADVGLVTQASLIDVEPMSDETIHYKYRGLSHDNLYSAYRDAWAVPADLAKSTSHVFVIEAHTKVPKTRANFIDEVHLTERGSTALAAIITHGVLARLREQHTDVEGE